MARWGATDPSTSRTAAEGAERSGLAQHHRELCLDAARDNPGETSAELAVTLGTRGHDLDRFQVARRLPELLAEGDCPGFLRQGERRKCRVTGRDSITWWPIGTGPAAPASGTAEAAPPAVDPVRKVSPAAPTLF